MQVERYGQSPAARSGGTSDLADILERVLDKGIVVAGDIAVNLLDIELLTIKLRLLIASADTAKKMGIDWWENDPFLNSRAQGSDNGDEERGPSPLEERLDRIEAAIEALGRPAMEPDGAERRETQ
jgi:hypothetical protein